MSDGSRGRSINGVTAMWCTRLLIVIFVASAGASPALGAQYRKKVDSSQQTKGASKAGCGTSGTASGEVIPLGALSGTDADALAQTLSSIFHGKFIVTTCADSGGDSGGSQPVLPTTSQSSASSKKSLQLQEIGTSSVSKCPADPQRCAFNGVETTLDQDNFKGGVLNSNYVIYAKGFANSLAAVFPHPVPDINVVQADDGKNDDCKSPDYIVLVPSPAVIGQPVVLQTLQQDAAGLKHDFELLAKHRQLSDACRSGDDELCLADNTIMLSVLDPRDVKLHANEVFGKTLTVLVFPLNNAVSLLPKGLSVEPNVTAIERYELYQQYRKQQQLLAVLRSAPTSPSSASSSPVTTTITSTTRTSLPSPPKTGGNTAQFTTTQISTTTSTTAQPAASSGSQSASAGNSSSSQGVSGASSQTTGGAPSTLAGTSAATGAQGSGSQAQPSQPSWDVDNIVRLYDYRDAAGIAAAINGMVSYSPNSRPIVEALSDNGANDLLEILPSAAAQGGYSIEDIERTIALLDLPRPQLSLEVWSYQISSRVRNSQKPYSSEYLKKPSTSTDVAQMTLRKINRKVSETNRKMIKALQDGMMQVYLMAVNSRPMCAQQGAGGCMNLSRSDPFFDETFREYLTLRNYQCVGADLYCLGYYNALDFPQIGIATEANDASLSRMLLFIAAAKDCQAKTLVKNIVVAMNDAFSAPGATECDPDHPRSCKWFPNFARALNQVTDKSNLHMLRAALLDFFFNYKWTLNYPNDFVPYDLRQSAHVLDDLLQPIDDAFNEDIDNYVQRQLESIRAPKTSSVGLVSQGMVQVATLSGTQGMVSGQVSNYFNITQTPSLSQVAQALLAGSAGGGPAGSGGSGVSGNSSPSAPPSSAQSSGASGSGGGTSAGGAVNSLQGLISTNPYVVGEEALASILSPPKITAQLTRGVTLAVTPTSLDTASSAELNVSLLVNEPDGSPQSVNTSAATQDLLDRVANLQVTDTVRVQSLGLFDISTLSMEITHPLTPTCVPLADDQPGRTFSYIVAVPFSVPCVFWRSIFGSVPLAGRLFEWPRSPITVDNRSLAIVRAVVVPTAMDLGLATRFEDDRVEDKLTQFTQALSSVRELGWRPRQFHKLMMQCVINPVGQQCPPKLSQVPEDLREPGTN